jgi:hypothetical protein
MKFTDFRNGYQLGESDGWFYLMSTVRCYRSAEDDDLGISGYASTTRFRTATERDYYIQIEHMRYELSKSSAEITSLGSAIRDCLTKTGRVRRKKLLTLAESLGERR